MNWIQEQNKLTKEIELGSFMQAIDYINQVAILAEQANHHPNICIYDYKNVRITLSTHDKGELTEKDFKLARELDKLNKQA